MADTLVETTVFINLARLQNSMFGPYWSDKSTAIIVFIDGGQNLNYARTTDKGATWVTTQVELGDLWSLSCWYDKETPGNSGTLIHIAWLDRAGADFAYYITLDVAADSLGTRRTVDATITISSASFTHNRLAITQTVSGNILIAFSTQSEEECYKSSDNFVTDVTSIATPYENGTDEDWCLLFPAATTDDNDACALFWDRSDNTISIKMYDDSADIWTETVIDADQVADAFHINMDGSVRHSDKHILVAAHSNDDDAGDDLRTWDLTVDSIAFPTVTAKTNVFTDQGESAQVSVFINQQNDDVYVAYLKGGTWLVAVDVVFHISADGMGSWGGEQAYSESAADNFQLVYAGRTVGDAGGRYQPAFFDDDDVDIYINETNDIEFAAVVGVDPSTEFAGTRAEHSDLSTYKLKQEVVGY